MKTCPVCHARCFEDMETCYGCLHRFGDGDFEPIDDLDVAEPTVLEPAVAVPAAAAAIGRLDGPACVEPAVGDDVGASGEGSGAADGGAGEGADAKRVTATVRPSRGMHGALVVRIEIPASMLRTPAVDVALEPSRR